MSGSIDNKIVRRLVTVFVTLTIIFSIFANSGVRVGADTGDAGEFVDLLIDQVYDMDVTEEEREYWIDVITRTNASDVVSLFFDSDELRARDLSNEEFVDLVYSVILGREADASGREFWVGQLNNGKSRMFVVNFFLNQESFDERCAYYGLTPRAEETNEDVTELVVLSPMESFIRRVYANFLGREATNGEVSTWTASLNKSTSAANFVLAVVNDSNSNINSATNTEFVRACYIALLGRDGSTSEINSWGVWLNTHSRRALLASFISSEEFTQICKTMGAIRGEITPDKVASSDAANLSAKQRFVNRCYLAFFDREPTANEYTNAINSFNRGTSAAKFIQNLVYSSAYKNKHVSNTEFVEDLYYATLGRMLDQKTADIYAAKLDNSSKYEMIANLTQTTEFKNNCKSYGITAGYIDLSSKCTWVRLNGSRALIEAETGFYIKCGWIYADGIRYYFNADGTMRQDVDSLIGRQSEYFIRVNTTSNCVTIYARTYAGGAFDTPVKAMICSCGLSNSPTIQGTFKLRPLGAWWPLMGNCWGQYCTQISGNYLFHSVWFHENGNKRSITVNGFNQLGNNASHGCVRLTVPDAKWIYDNCGGSTVNVSTSQPQPFDKPARYAPVVVRGDYGYDPRDPGL